MQGMPAVHPSWQYVPASHVCSIVGSGHCLPALHSRGADAPAGQYDPWEQLVKDLAPPGQKVPAGHWVGADRRSAAQKLPGGQGTCAENRIMVSIMGTLSCNGISKDADSQVRKDEIRLCY